MTSYERQLILAVETLGEHINTANLLEIAFDYTLYPADTVEEAVKGILKQEYKFELPTELEAYFDMKSYIKDFTQGGTWYETDYGVLYKED